MSRPLNTSADSLLFKAGVRRTEKKTAPVSDVTLDSAGEILSVLSGTFRYDSPGSPIKSTQQLNVDFSDFSQHTFFNSAGAKTQKAFDRIINKMPFDGKNQNELFRKIQRATFTMPKIFSPNLQDLLSKMLEKEPRRRITAAEAIKHPWFKELRE